MQAKSFSELVTFSRSTVARYFNAAGLMVQAAVNEPRFEYNPATLQPMGLKMEPARTNTLTYSQDFSNAAWVKTQTTVALSGTAPDGTATSYKLTMNAATGSNYLYRTGVAWTAGNTYSFSVFAKADTSNILYLQLNPTAFGVNQQVNFQLSGDGTFIVAAGTPLASIQRLPNGWYKCSIIATATVTTAAANWIAISQPTGLNNAILAWGAQLEVGAWHSSYIPTTSAAASRALDQAFLADLAPWYNTTEGTIYSEVVSNTSGFAVNIGTTVGTGPRIANWRTSTNAASQVINNAGVTVLAQAFGAVNPGQVIKQALAFKLNDLQAAAGGVVGPVDTDGDIPTPTRMAIGARGVANDPISGHIRKIKFYPYRLSAAELQAMTT